MSMWVCRVVWCCVLCCVVLCCAVLCCVEGWLHWSPAFISEMRRTHLPDYSRYAHTHSSASLQSEWGKQRGRPSERCHMGPRRKKKDRFLKWSSSLALVLLCYLFFFLLLQRNIASRFCFPRPDLFFFPLSAERRCRWWSAKLKTPCPLWWEGWCRTDTTTTTTITQVAARPADRTACRRASPTAGRISWTSPRSSCSTPPSTRRGRCWR